MSDVPGRFPVSVGGRSYVADLRGFQRQSLQTIREQSDVSESPGEQSLSPLDLWRRSQDRWSHGAGQEHLDKRDSSPRRFRRSDGVNPWDDGYLRLLPDVSQVLASTWTAPELAVVGGRLYVTAGTVLRYTSDLATWTDTAAFPSNVVSITTDGFTVYCMTASHGVYTVTLNVDTPGLLNNLNGDKVWYVKGRLMAAAGPDLYNITDVSSTVAPDPLTPNVLNSDWRWTDAGEGGQFIYVSGFSRNKSMVYRVTIREDGTALSAPTVAAELPNGEICRSVQGYVGSVLLGTSKGVRVASTASGYLDYGPLLEVGSVRDMEAQGSQVWFTRGAEGLGRVELGEFVDALQPAYASDLASPGAGDVLSVVTFNGKRVFTQDNVYAEADGLVAEGRVWLGNVAFDLPDPKSFEYVSVRHDPLPAGASVTVVPHVDGVAQPALVSDVDGSTGRENMVVGVAGDRIELEIVLSGDVRLSRVTLRALPIPSRGEAIQVPLLLREAVEDHNGGTVAVDPQDEFDFLKGLERDGLPVSVELFGESLRAVLDGVQLGPELDYTWDKSFVQGVCTVVLRSWS